MLSSKLKDEAAKLLAMPDEEIDYSDIPKLSDEQLEQFSRYYRPIKKHLTLRIDADVLAWFEKHNNFRDLINQICRIYMRQHLKSLK